MMFPKIKLPSLGVRPIFQSGHSTIKIKLAAPKAPPEDSNALLALRSRTDEERAVETFKDNEQRASNPAGNPIWILKPPQAGKDKTFG